MQTVADDGGMMDPPLPITLTRIGETGITQGGDLRQRKPGDTAGGSRRQRQAHLGIRLDEAPS